MHLPPPVITIGWLLALMVVLLAILGVIGLVPATAPIVFGLIGVLAVARLL
jgi:hypothetical protein